jgi:uncharacterized membrane protein YhdT
MAGVWFIYGVGSFHSGGVVNVPLWFGVGCLDFCTVYLPWFRFDFIKDGIILPWIGIIWVQVRSGN